MTENSNKGYYDESALIEIKVPMQMPYLMNQTEYERWDGEIEFSGVHYNYVKRKVYNDTLYLLCLPNERKTSLNNERTTYARNIGDSNDPAKKSAENSFKKIAFASEYDQPETSRLAVMAFKTHFTHGYAAAYIPNIFADIPLQPPELFS